ncbi:hypothetical protein OSB04_020762 [Centaurea solstitialis]|uniref:Transposase MuDR plant domain-containing protein n=1 Tax=Centaurea solstitialis TaxID=347529 RepID=A0AA38SSW6_9ASTR|nr:hypothetical protein OSB04_020762 [Centaurea solstitialis]
MNSEIRTTRMLVSYGGSWQQHNEDWRFVTEMPVLRLLVPVNVTYSRFVRVIKRKCGIDASDFVTRIAYMEPGVNGVYILSSQEDVTQFLEKAANENDVPTVYVYNDSQNDSGGNVEGVSDTVGDESPYIPQFDSVEIPSNTSYVPETEEPEEDEAVPEEDEPQDFDNYVFHTSDVDDEETRREAYFVRSYPGNDDFHDMPPPLRRKTVKEDQIFRSKPEMTLALGLKFLEEGFEFKTVRSAKRRYEAVCVYENCGWRIYATSIGDSEMFQVRKLNDVHTCSRTQMHPAHRQATRRVLAHLLLDKTGDISRTIRGCDIIRDIKSRYRIDISYWQAWRAKWRAIFLIEGNPAESFTRLPQYFYNVELRNPGTVTDIRTDVTGRFERCFFALGCSIQTFRSGLLRKVLIVDGAHLKGDYLGTMFLAVAMDANNKLSPSQLELQSLRVEIHTCRAYTTYEFELRMSALRAAVPGASLLDRVNPNRWSRALFPGVRYNILSSNSVECMNAHSKFARRGVIVGLMEYFRSFQQEWYSKRRHFAATLTNPLTPWAEVRVQRRVVKSASWVALDIGYVNWPFLISLWITLRQHTLRSIYPVGPYVTWCTPNSPLMTVRPPVLKTGPGAKSKHKRIPSRGEGSSTQRCSRCRLAGHSRNQCTESLPSQRPSEWTQQMDDNLPTQRPSGSRQGEATTTQQTSDEGTRYSFDLNDDLNIDLNY